MRGKVIDRRRRIERENTQKNRIRMANSNRSNRDLPIQTDELGNKSRFRSRRPKYIAQITLLITSPDQCVCPERSLVVP